LQILSDVGFMLLLFLGFLRTYQNIRYFLALQRNPLSLIGWVEVVFKSEIMLPFPIFARQKPHEVRRLARKSNYTLAALYFGLVLSWIIAMNNQYPAGTAQ